MSIIELDENKIRIKAKKEIVNIEGNNLLIEYMTETDIKISGKINLVKIVEVIN